MPIASNQAGAHFREILERYPNYDKALWDFRFYEIVNGK
jgi:hypothetical protein